MLGVGGGLAARFGGGQVGYGGGVAGGPGVRHALDAEGGGAAEPAAFGEGQVGGGQQGGRFHARGPDEGAGGEAGAVAEDGDAVLAGVEAGFEAYVDVAAAQLADGVRAHGLADLGEDPPGRLDEDPFQVGRLDVVVVPGGVAGHVLQLRQRLHAGVAAADEDEGQSGVADGGVTGGGGDVHLFDDVVAQPDGLLDGLETDAEFGQPGNGQGA